MPRKRYVKSKRCKEDDLMSEQQIQKAFEAMGLGTEEERNKILTQGTLPDYETKKTNTFETWTSPYTDNGEV
jgi:hypothetical protein